MEIQGGRKPYLGNKEQKAMFWVQSIFLRVRLGVEVKLPVQKMGVNLNLKAGWKFKIGKNLSEGWSN